jgi:ABC-type lipoprotein release transport system permease subunit
MDQAKLPIMAWRNLWRNRRRTLLTLSSIAFGVFLAIIITAIQDNSWTQMINHAARMGGGHVTIQHPEYLDTPTFSRTVGSIDAKIEIAERHANVENVVQRISGPAMMMSASETFGAGIIAYDPRAENEETLALLEAIAEGERLSSPDDRGIILGSKLAQNLGVEMGDRVVYTMADRRGEIVSGLGRLSGILRTGAPSADAGLALLPIGAVREVLGYAPDETLQLAVFISDRRLAEQVARDLQREIDDDAAALPWFEVRPELAAFIAMKVVGSQVMEVVIAILVAAGIFNTLFVSVMERLREFGILMAIGFSPGKLFRMVMYESLWMALLGLVGAGILTVGPYYYLATTGIDFTKIIGDSTAEIAGVALTEAFKAGIYPESLAFIIVAAVTAVLLSGLYPAWKAGRVEPVETIKLV